MSRRISLAERLLTGGVRLLAICPVVVVMVIVVFVAQGAMPVLQSVGWPSFLVDQGWHPTEGRFNLTPMLVASAVSSLGALLLALPVGVAMAVFCRFHAGPGVAVAYKRALGVFAGVPSVVYGFWGLIVLVPFIAERFPPGASLFSGILILTLMILPTVALTSESALSHVPVSYLHGGHALGVSQRSVVFKIALYAARAGVLSGAILALARALGETMAVMMVSGNLVNMPSSVFDPVRTLAANIALEMAYAMHDHKSALFASGTVLLLIVGVLMLISDRLTRSSHA